MGDRILPVFTWAHSGEVRLFRGRSAACEDVFLLAHSGLESLAEYCADLWQQVGKVDYLHVFCGTGCEFSDHGVQTAELV